MEHHISNTISTQPATRRRFNVETRETVEEKLHRGYVEKRNSRLRRFCIGLTPSKMPRITLDSPHNVDKKTTLNRQRISVVCCDLDSTYYLGCITIQAIGIIVDFASIFNTESTVIFSLYNRQRI